ncbi:NHL repeat containing protein [Neobacillus bataviensis LMG 21833]|uniref:NHL repeat containing protein n=1 Tax=Neobacillus bataviensis LMG 21833 TaxID=1117379 RepID=K6CYA2_9BACI|nr:Yip1 family protein [Neobacillus bataviensis]EKN65207.1 NHL repeat containing protein [Neobacillus bataviensis LMG 21833]
MSPYLSALSYSLHLIFRPFDGFWDLKKEKRGSVAAASTITLLVVVTFIVGQQYTAFLFNFNNVKELNIYLEIASVLLPFLLFCTANWCLTSLADGEGTFKDIFIAAAYSLTPIILINVPLVILSHVLNFEEGAFYYFFLSISLLWSAALLFFGTMVTHQYSLKRTALTIVGILIGMGLIVFIALLFTSVIQQIIGFFYIIYKEIRFRV